MTILNERPAATGYTLIKWFGYGLAVVGALLTLFTIAHRNDALTIVLLAIPIIVFILLLLAPQAFAMTARGGRIRTLSAFTALPILVMLGVTFGAGVMDVGHAFAPAALCGAITLLLGLALASRRLPGSLIAGLIFFGLYGAAYGYAAMIFADTRLDHGESQTFQTQVLQHATYSGRSSHYDLTLAPWGSLTQPDTVRVPHAVYSAVQIGETVCITLHPGLLRMPWRTAAPCPAS